MLLLDSLHINNSGGKILLEYLVEQLEKNKIQVFYLFDERCKDDFKNVPTRRKLYLKANLINRHRFYRKKGSKFSHVFCFGNLSPTISLNVPVYTYFHQALFLETPKSITLKNKISLKVKKMILSSIKTNTKIWFVQSENIRNQLIAKFELPEDEVILMPFYPPLTKSIDAATSGKRRKDGFVYISNGGTHKNHINLIIAFCNHFDQFQKGSLHLTVSEEFPQLLEFIKNKVEQGYPIINHGFVLRNKLVEIYQTNEYLIFPSLTESFGLGLVEAIENGCKVIGADLPYTYAVCNASILFDPHDIKDIERALSESQMETVKDTEQLVFNEIKSLINYIKN